MSDRTPTSWTRPRPDLGRTCRGRESYLNPMVAEAAQANTRRLTPSNHQSRPRRTTPCDK